MLVNPNEILFFPELLKVIEEGHNALYLNETIAEALEIE